MYFRSLELENVRAFGRRQTLAFFDQEGAISRWNLILGENGVGKTTVLEVLAAMRPIPSFENDEDRNQSEDAGPPTFAKAELSAHENTEISGFVRTGAAGRTTISAVLQTLAAEEIKVGVEITGKIPGDFETVTFKKAGYALRSVGPLVFGYGAARHVGHENLSVVAERNANTSLAAQASDLYDAEEIIERLAVASLMDPDPIHGKDRQRFSALKAAIASLLPDATADDIDWRGPRIASRGPLQSGVHIHTPSGMTELRALSIGYQTMFAWTVDLAWRLFSNYPDSQDPLSESAIVLIDEIDLHLHPRWQRELRNHLLRHFSGIQFIATTHSPITAQETLSEGGNVCVVRWAGSEAEILNNPLPGDEWRFDQILASKLFGFASSRSKAVENLFEERLALIRNEGRTAEDEARLQVLDEAVLKLPTASSPSLQGFENLMAGFIRDFPESVRR